MIQSIDPVAFGATLSSAFKFDLIANKPKATVLEALAVDDAMRMLWKQTILPNYVIKLNFFSIFKICNLPWGSLLAKSERLSKSQINRIRTSDRPYQAKRFEANEKKQMRRMNRKLLLGSITKERKFVIRTRRWSAFWKRSMRKQISAHQSNSLQTLRLTAIGLPEGLLSVGPLRLLGSHKWSVGEHILQRLQVAGQCYCFLMPRRFRKEKVPESTPLKAFDGICNVDCR